LLLRSCLLYMKCVGRRVRRGEVTTAPRRLEDGTACRRRVCFFTHAGPDLRPPAMSSFPTSTLVSPPRSPPSESTPMSSDAAGVLPAAPSRGSARPSRRCSPRCVSSASAAEGVTPAAACSCSASPDEHWGRAATAAPVPARSASTARARTGKRKMRFFSRQYSFGG
jgi:hypothetical protein